MREVDVSAFVHKAVRAVRWKIQEVDGLIPVKVGHSFSYDVLKRLEPAVPLGDGDVGGSIPSEQETDFSNFRVTGLSPELGSPGRAERHHIRLEVLSDTDLDREQRKGWQVERPQESFHENVAALLVALLDENDLPPVGPEGPLAAEHEILVHFANSNQLEAVCLKVKESFKKGANG